MEILLKTESQLTVSRCRQAHKLERVFKVPCLDGDLLTEKRVFREGARYSAPRSRDVSSAIQSVRHPPMKLAISLAVLFAVWTMAHAGDVPAPKMDVAAEIVRVKVQDYSHALVELKLQEVALRQATPVDNDKLAVVRAQEAAINQELLHLAIGPLEAKLAEAEKIYSPGNRKLIDLRQEIERKTMEMRDAGTVSTETTK